MSTTEDVSGAPERADEQTGRPRKGAANAIEIASPEGAADGGRQPAAAAEVKPSRRKGTEPPVVATSEAQRDVIPDAVQGRFIQVGRQFYFPDGAEAFTDHGRRLTTRSENAVVIQSMVAIAQARGATELQVSGSEFFRKEAWFAARVAGLDVRGYTPSELEQERVARAVGRRDASARGEAAETNALQAPSATRPERAAAPAAPAASDLIVGRLIDHGVAPFQHRPDRAMSYYVRLETERGEVEHWGLDLERALRQSLSRPGIGDEVGLRKVGSDPVTVRASKRDAQGREIGQEAISARRNQWVLEKKEFVDERARMAALFRDASVSAAEATRRHPELDGSYVHLQMGNALAEERFKSKLHREQFVEHLREYLARRIEQGQPLDPVPLRPRRGDGQDPKVHDRDYAPAR